MTHLIWTKFFVASLIFLGDGPVTHEVNHRSDIETSIISHIAEATSYKFSDDLESNSHPTLISDNKLETDSSLIYQGLSPANRSVSYSSRYHTFNPRAPPVFVS